MEFIKNKNWNDESQNGPDPAVKPTFQGEHSRFIRIQAERATGLSLVKIECEEQIELDFAFKARLENRAKWNERDKMLNV